MIRTTELRKKCGDHKKFEGYVYPDHFFAIDDHFTMHIPFWNFLFKEIGFVNKDDLNLLEIGTSQGRSSVWLLENVLTGISSKLTTIDLNHLISPLKLKTLNNEYIDNIEWSCLENLQPYIESGKCEFFQSSSDDFFNFLKTKQEKKKNSYCNISYNFIENIKNFEIFDLIYIDGSHDPDQVLKDGINSFEFLKPNGYILFDDYPWKNPRTNLICGLGIESFLQAFNHKIKILHKDYQVLIQKI